MPTSNELLTTLFLAVDDIPIADPTVLELNPVLEDPSPIFEPLFDGPPDPVPKLGEPPMFDPPPVLETELDDPSVLDPPSM